MDALVLTNARFYTFNPFQPIAERLVILDQQIIAAGSVDKIALDAFPKSKIVDLQGMCVLPALTDSHIHMLEYGLSLRRVACETKSKQECIQRVRTRVQATPQGKWVLGHGWNHNIWVDGAPDKEVLDSFSPGTPIYLTHKSLHSAWVNSAALKIAGITREMPDPSGGLIGRSGDGEPNGIVYESAMRLIENVIPKPDNKERKDALTAAQKELHQFGISGVHDFDQWDCYETLEEMETSGDLTLRVVKNIPYPELDQVIEAGIKSGMGSKLLSFGWLKLFADGALGPQTAAMLSPYEGSESKGLLLLNSEDIIGIGQKAMSKGLSLAVHAIGDLANHEVINGYAQLMKLGFLEPLPLRPRIEHVQLISPQDIPRLAQLGITAAMQPIHAVSDRDMADRHWGERCDYAYAWNSVRQSGTPLIFGSDAPVESPNPFWGLFSSVSRSSLGNEAARSTWTPHQRMSLQDALIAFYPKPFLVSDPEFRTGKIQNGYAADLVVLPDDIFNLPENDLVSVMPAATMVDGRWVFKQI